MWSLKLSFLLGLAYFISCQNYDELLADVCFRKIYVCGDHRWGVTESDGRLISEPRQFGEMCRKHKKFIACVDDAISNHCNDSFSDLAKMTLSNRYSLKMFCTIIEWRQIYFSSVQCINENEEKIQEECKNEENVYDDGRPWWCLIPEPCDALRRVFNCSVWKMKDRCGGAAAEVFRRMRILEAENQDVVCEFRRQNPRYCRYERQKRHSVSDSKEKSAYNLSNNQSDMDELYNVLRRVLLDTIENVEEQRQNGFSDIIDSDNMKLRKLLAIKSETSPNQVGNDSMLLKRFGFQENLNEVSDLDEIQKLRELIVLEQLEFRKKSKILSDLDLKLKNFIFELIDMMRSGHIIIGHLNENTVDIYWSDLQFPVQSMACDRVFLASRKVFKCSLNWHNEVQNLNNAMNKKPESVSNDPNLTGNEAEASNYAELLPNLDLFDIHRYGYETIHDDLGVSGNEHNVQDINDAVDNTSQIPTEYVLIESPYSTEPSTEPSSDHLTEFYSNPLESTTFDSTTHGDFETNFIEGVTESLQLREIEEAINEKLESVDTKSKIPEYCSLDDPTKDCGNKGSVFSDYSDSDLQESEDIPITTALDEETLSKKTLNQLNRDGTTTEDPFYEAIERLAMEEYERRARDKEIESFLSEKEMLLAREREKKEFESFQKETK